MSKSGTLDMYCPLSRSYTKVNMLEQLTDTRYPLHFIMILIIQDVNNNNNNNKNRDVLWSPWRLLPYIPQVDNALQNLLWGCDRYLSSPSSSHQPITVCGGGVTRPIGGGESGHVTLSGQSCDVRKDEEMKRWWTRQQICCFDKMDALWRPTKSRAWLQDLVHRM